MSAAPTGGEAAVASTPSFEPFDLSISLGPESTPWLSAGSCAGFVHGVPRNGGALPGLQALLDQVYDYVDAVQFAEFEPDPELARILGDLAFGDPMVRQLFQATRGVAADHGRQVLVRILASPHLATLPWELLPDPAAPRGDRERRYLALAPDAHVVRVARARTYSARSAWLEPPLNLLIVLSSPTPQSAAEDWLAFDVFQVKGNLLAELSPLVDAGLLNVDIEDHPTVENLRRRIGAQRRGYHLFHYVGHALPDRLILEDRAGRREDLASNKLVELLRLCPDLRLAVFAGCETARAAGDPGSLDARAAVGWRDLLSLADYCVQEACPAVIGMQAVLPFSTERVFTRFFYQGLASGYTLAESLRLARGAIQADERVGGDLLDWSVPALFVGASEPGALVPRATRAQPVLRPRRVELKLGLRQRSDEFFARDLPLRQAVDVMAARTGERVLLVTGPPGVGKTFLVDRALEELAATVTHVLYVHFDRLAPEWTRACAEVASGTAPDLDALERLPSDGVLERLCRLADELLRPGNQAGHVRDAAWSPWEWWERLVEELVRHRLVLAIDEIGRIDWFQLATLQALVGRWLAEVLRAHERETTRERFLADVQWVVGSLQKLEQRSDQSLAPAPQGLRQGLERMRQDLPEIPKRMHELSIRALRVLLEDFLVEYGAHPSKALSAALGASGPAALQAIAPEQLAMLLRKLEDVRTSIGAALNILADRRSAVRIVLTAADVPSGLMERRQEEIFVMRLAQLTWPETWRWIRRNLPGLVSYGEQYLCSLWPKLGVRTDRWEELERRALRARGQRLDLPEAASEIAPMLPKPAPAARSRVRLRRGERPLRIAAAGPLLSGPRGMAEAITRLAVEHGIGGQVTFGGATELGALATLIDEPLPFAVDGVSSEAQVLKWLNRVASLDPDIILLDYGRLIDAKQVHRPRHESAERLVLGALHYRSLLIAAGGNEVDAQGSVSATGAYPEVFSVGAIDSAGDRRPYSEWHRQLGTPDVFMADDLAGTALAAALKPEVLSREIRGSSFSALHAVAASALVWSLLPELTPRAVRALLLDASTRHKKDRRLRRLTVADAVAVARRGVVERTLRAGPCSLQTLSAITGLDVPGLSVLLDDLVHRRVVARLPAGRLERFQLL